jgi:hypothetical protein
MAFKEGASLEEYKKLHKFSVDHSNIFWPRLARELFVAGESPSPWNVEAFHSEDRTHMVKYMPNARTNACINILDRNIDAGLGEQDALH